MSKKQKQAPVPLTPEEIKGYREQFEKGAACTHCGGLHLRACPRVKRLAFTRANEISEVEFWPHGRWPQSDIIWPEDVYDEGAGYDGTKAGQEGSSEEAGSQGEVHGSAE